MTRAKYPSDKQDQFMLRLPDGLRDRIKTYAERNGRSMNAEIVRILEREYPEQWPISDRLGYLADLIHIVKQGTGDEQVERFVSTFEETVEAIRSGRATGIDEKARERIDRLWTQYKDRESWKEYEADRDRQSDLDEEELASLERNGTTEKFAIPLPRAKNMKEMTDEELEEYAQRRQSEKSDSREESPASEDDPFKD